MGYCSTYFNGSRGMMRGNILGMGFIWWLLIAVLIVAVIYFMKNQRDQSHETMIKNTSNSAPASVHSSALDLLDEEFVKGTISGEEYLHKKELLKQ